MRGRKPVIPPLSADVVDLPTAATRVPEPPDYLQGRALECWKMVVTEMVLKQIYDTDCRDQTAAYCVQLARFLDAEDKLAQLGEDGLTEMGRWGSRPSVWVQISNQSCDRMARLATELGITPVARKRAAKVRGTPGAAAAKFLAKRA